MMVSTACSTVFSECNDQGDTELIHAARFGDVPFCLFLLEDGADVNAFNEYNSQTALLAAIEKHHGEVVDLLLAHGADVQMADNVGITPIYAAIKIKDDVVRHHIVSQLIFAGCDVNIGSQDHVPLFLASRLGALSVVKMLCEAKCDINISNKYGVTPLYEAVMNGPWTQQDYPLINHVHVDYNVPRLLFLLSSGHYPVVEYLLSKNCCLNKQDMYGVTALHVAAMFDKKQAVKLLLQAGACVKIRDQDGRCAVHVAIEHGKAPIVEMFLKHGIDITCPPTSIKKLPCLKRAAQNGFIDTIHVLIQGCSNLPVEEIMDIFRDNYELLQLFLLSGVHRQHMKTLTSYLASFQDPSQNSMLHLKKFFQSVSTLKHLCRVEIRNCLGNKILYSSEFLPLPSTLKSYICLDDIL